MNESKKNYFSNAAYSYAAFTDQQRNEFDLEMRASLETANRKIAELNEIIEKSYPRCRTYVCGKIERKSTSNRL